MTTTATTNSKEEEKNIYQEWVDLQKLTVFIETWSSTCGNCKRDCDYSEKKHNTVLGYGVKEGEQGCGIEWKYVSTNYPMLKDRVKTLRPDLEPISMDDHILNAIKQKRLANNKGEFI